MSTCGLHVYEQFHPNHTKIQSSVHGMVLNQSLLFITQSNPNKLSPMGRFTYPGLCTSVLVAELAERARRMGQRDFISSFSSSIAKVLAQLSLLIG